MADLGKGMGGMHPPHQPKPNDFGEAVSISAKTFFFIFFGDHLILGGKNV